MKYLFILLVISFSFGSCRSKMDKCVENGRKQGLTKAQAKERCKQGQEDSYRR